MGYIVPIDFVKLWRKAHIAFTSSELPVGMPWYEPAAARVLEQAFTTAVEEERRKALEEAAIIAENGPFYESDVAEAIRALIGSR